jgi:hypothetical protein
MVSGYMVRRTGGNLVGPFRTEQDAKGYLQPGDEIVRVNEHGVIIDYGPQFGEEDE